MIKRVRILWVISDSKRRDGLDGIPKQQAVVLRFSAVSSVLIRWEKPDGSASAQLFHFPKVRYVLENP